MRGVRTAVGIDPGSKATGMALVELGRSSAAVGVESAIIPFAYVRTMVVETPVGAASDRRDVLRREISERIVPFVVDAKPDLVFIEDPMSFGIDGAKKLCTVRVMIEEALWHVLGETPMTIHPSTWRAHVRRIYGRPCPPKQIKALASIMLGMDPKTTGQDMADAVWIAATGLYSANGESWDIGD